MSPPNTRGGFQYFRRRGSLLGRQSRGTCIGPYLQERRARPTSKCSTATGPCTFAVFSFFYFLKIKISKIYVRFEIFQKYPRSPPIGRQALSVIFFLQIRNEVPEKKKGLSPVGGRQGPSLFINPGRHMPPFPLSFEPKNSGKKLECLPCCYIFLK